MDGSSPNDSDNVKLDINKLNFERCEEEQIHIPESIQGYGYLFALDENDYTIQIHSSNIDQLLKDGDECYQSNFFDLLAKQVDIDFVKETFEKAESKDIRLPVRLRFDSECITTDSEIDFYAVVYKSEKYFVIELEPAGKFRETYSARHYMKLYGSKIAPKFSEFNTLDELAQEIVDTIKYITGMERVVLYRFKNDGGGKVIAEAKVDDIESYLHLHYPPSDIPAQARALYKKNWVRLVPNVNLEPSVLVPSTKELGREPLDMTHSILRSLSPIHLQYVRNQGLMASMSMSLVTHDNLWGIISCHSRETKYVPQNVRLECENLSQLFSWHLYAKEEEFYIKKKEKTDKAIDSLLRKNALNKSIVNIFKENTEEVLSLVDADGFMFYTKGEHVSIGKTPDLQEVIRLSNEVSAEHEMHFTSQDVSDKIEDDKLNGIRGIMLTRLLDERNYFTAWFRKETVEVQRWAGKPGEKSISASKLERLEPRSSFAVNEVTIEGNSTVWEDQEIEIAERFNKVFMAYALSTQESMRQDISDLKIQDQYKDEFLATLAHELRNPLSPIVAGISLLNDEIETEETQTVLEMMQRQADHMSTMINDLMDVSRITRGKVNLELEPVSIQEALNNAIEACSTNIESKNHNITLTVPDKNFMIEGDKTRLAQIFVNIINNAVKYTPKGGDIAIQVSNGHEHVKVSIKDNGIGISPDDLETVFNMFTQINRNTNVGGGLGIGLTLVEKLIKLHNGSISAYSEGKNKGSEFLITFPALHENTSIDDGSIKRLKKETSDKKRKVLVVDDNIDILTMFSILLRKAGYEVATAESGTEGIEKYQSFQPDVAFLDIGMPDMTGYELCKKLRQLPGAERTTFFSQSGWGSKEHVLKSKEAGFKRHFVKPMKIAQIKEALEAV